MFVQVVFVLFSVVSSITVSAQSHCLTPEAIPGQCISLSRCSNVLARYREQSSTTIASYLRSLQCESEDGEFPHVCCVPPPPRPNRQASKELYRRATPQPLPRFWPLPQLASPQSQSPAGATLTKRINSGRGNVLPSECPETSPERNRIYGGVAAQLDDYPWTALLEYQNRLNPQQTVLGCGGSLISIRYVLTAAHCLVGEVKTKIGKLVGVRLGEYDITKQIDCLDGKCADPVTYIGVEETIPHPGYIGRNGSRQNDIGLVRMDGDVNYTDYIKPICLPSTANSWPSIEFLASAGWGRTLTKYQSTTKQRIYLPLYDQDKCIQQYQEIDVVVGDTQFCAGGIKGQDTCEGDSGNALIRISSSSWVVEGVVSYGRSCGVPDRPAVYTRVSAFNEWILTNLKP